MDVPKIFDLPNALFTFMELGEKFPPSIPATGWQLPENGHTYQEALEHPGNIGFIAGRGYIGFDLDDPSAFERLSLPPTCTWATRPGRYGKLFTGEVLPEVMTHYGKAPNHAQFILFKDGLQVGEIKLERCYQVIPNSWKILDDGQKVFYELVDGRSPAPIDLGKLLADILALPGLSLTQKPKTKSAPGKIAKSYMPAEAHNRPVAALITNDLSYACAALLSELAKTERAPVSTRFNQVYRSAAALGEFVGAGLLPEVPTFNALVEAGVTSGLDRQEAIKSATNGMKKGMKNPRKVARPTTDEARMEGMA